MEADREKGRESEGEREKESEREREEIGRECSENAHPLESGERVFGEVQARRERGGEVGGQERAGERESVCVRERKGRERTSLNRKRESSKKCSPKRNTRRERECVCESERVCERDGKERTYLLESGERVFGGMETPETCGPCLFVRHHLRSGIGPPFSGPLFVLALAGIRRLPVQTKAPETDDLLRL